MLTNIQNIAELPLWQNKVINIWKNWGDIQFCQFTMLVNVLFHQFVFNHVVILCREALSNQPKHRQSLPYLVPSPFCLCIFLQLCLARFCSPCKTSTISLKYRGQMFPFGVLSSPAFYNLLVQRATQINRRNKAWEDQVLILSRRKRCFFITLPYTHTYQNYYPPSLMLTSYYIQPRLWAPFMGCWECDLCHSDFLEGFLRNFTLYITPFRSSKNTKPWSLIQKH